MKKSFDYEGYAVNKEGEWYVARTLDPADDGTFEMCSRVLIHVLRAIDELWLSLASNTSPSWMKDWDGSTPINLDDYKLDHLQSQAASAHQIQPPPALAANNIKPGQKVLLMGVALAAAAPALTHNLIGLAT
jgi:hypothetical protein